MTLEKLKAMLESGAITKDEYTELLEKLGLKEEEPPADDVEKRIQQEVEKRVQQAIDRATNKLGNDLKALREENERLKKEKMSDDERAQYEKTQYEATLKEREDRVSLAERRLYALSKLRSEGLDDGTEDSASLVDYVMAEDEKGIDARVSGFKTAFNKRVQSQVDATFKKNGREPNGGNSDTKKDDKQDSAVALAQQIGKQAAEANKTAQSVIDQYIGGNN